MFYLTLRECPPESLPLVANGHCGEGGADRQCLFVVRFVTQTIMAHNFFFSFSVQHKWYHCKHSRHWTQHSPSLYKFL